MKRTSNQRITNASNTAAHGRNIGGRRLRALTISDRKQQPEFGQTSLPVVLPPLRFVHRLDADRSGILLLAKSPGAVNTFGGLFESRSMAKVYLAVVRGLPKASEWTCRLKLGRTLAENGG